VKETPGIGRFQIIQTGPAELSLRMEAQSGADPSAVWDAVQTHLGAYLQKQGLANVAMVMLPEPPVRDPKSGKFRHVWSAFHSIL
jgi:hypothetical protein